MNAFSRLTIVAGGTLLASAALAQLRFENRPGYQELTGQMIVRPIQIDAALAKGWTLQRTNEAIANSRLRLRPLALKYNRNTDTYVVRVPRGSNENRFANDLMRTGEYEYAHPNWKCFPVGTPNDPMFDQQWHLRTIQAPAAWDLWTGSSSFITAFVDTGIDLNHEDLKDLRVPGFNSVDRKAEVDGGQVADINGHGTHVAGDGSAHGNNGKGVSGVAWNHRVMMVRTSNSAGGGASLDDITQGAIWAAQNGAKTVSASYSGVDAALVGTAGTVIKNTGSLFLYAAGNDNRDLTGFRHADTIVVGSSNESDEKSGFSAYGRGCTLFAPGSSIMSTKMGGGYGFSSGTSMATPVANGGLALLWSANPTLTNEDAREILFNTCDNIGSSTIFGFGRINVRRAVEAALVSAVRDIEIDSVSVQSGIHFAGNLGSVRDLDLGNNFGVSSVTQIGVGSVAGSTLGVKLPTNLGTISSFSLSTTVKYAGNKPSSVFVYVLNKNTGRYDQITTRGIFPNADATINVRLSQNVSNYVAADGTVSMILRDVVPSRFGTSVGRFQIGYASAKFSVRP
jgi:thermitase